MADLRGGTVAGLLGRDPAYVASAVARSLGQMQAGAGQQSGAGAISADQFLRELKGMDPKAKGEIMRKAVQGIPMLPPGQQAQLISTAMKVKRDTAAGAQASPEQLQLAREAHEAFRDVPAKDMNELGNVFTQASATEAAKDPAKLVLVAKELPPEDRAEFQQILIESNVVPPEQEALLHEALQPNGVLDQVGFVVEYIEIAKKFSRYLLIIPAGEFVLGILLAGLQCDAPFAAWMHLDGLGMLLMLAGFYAACKGFESVKDPVLSQAVNTPDPVHIMNTLPEDQKTMFILGVAGLALAILSLLCQVCWAVWGFFLFFSMASCNLLVSFLFHVFGIKSFVVLGVVVFAAYKGKQLYDKVGGGDRGMYRPAPGNAGPTP